MVRARGAIAALLVGLALAGCGVADPAADQAATTARVEAEAAAAPADPAVTDGRVSWALTEEQAVERMAAADADLVDAKWEEPWPDNKGGFCRRGQLEARSYMLCTTGEGNVRLIAYQDNDASALDRVGAGRQARALAAIAEGDLQRDDWTRIDRNLQAALEKVGPVPVKVALGLKMLEVESPAPSTFTLTVTAG